MVFAFISYCLYNKSTQVYWLNTDLVPYRSEGRKSGKSLWGLKSRCCEGLFLLEALRVSLLPGLFQLREAAWVLWLVAPSSIFKAYHSNFSQPHTGNFLVSQWLGLHCNFTAEGSGSIPGWGSKIPQAVWCSKKKKKKTETEKRRMC